MKPSGHIIASGIIGIAVLLYFKSLPCAIASFAAGILVDLDHFFDYYLNYRFTLKIRDIYYACLEVNLKRLYVIFHSYELVIALWLLIYYMSLGNIWKALAIGATQHMIIDQITNTFNMFGYFLIYRILHGFKKELIIDPRKEKA